MTEVVLYDFWRSSAAYRVRIALNLKGVAYRSVAIDLTTGVQSNADYTALNPQGLVPALQIDGLLLTQSLAIIDYLDAQYKDPPMVSSDPASRSRTLAQALLIAADIHPINNLRVLRYLVHTLGISDDAKSEWYRHWVREGFAAIEGHLASDPAPGRFCHGGTPTFAECFLVPQVYNAQRFNVDMAPYPNIVRINDACAALPAFVAAHPAQQPDAE